LFEDNEEERSLALVVRLRDPERRELALEYNKPSTDGADAAATTVGVSPEWRRVADALVGAAPSLEEADATAAIAGVSLGRRRVADAPVGAALSLEEAEFPIGRPVIELSPGHRALVSIRGFPDEIDPLFVVSPEDGHTVATGGLTASASLDDDERG
jgi:hypothetical protein